MQVTATMPYRKSLRKRLRVLFSALRFGLFIAAIVFAVSVAPLLAFAGRTVATDYSLRQQENHH